MVKPEWGIKRTCQACSAHFYDLKKSPIVCPKCGAEFNIEVLKQKKTKAVAAAIPPEERLLREDVAGSDFDTNPLDASDELLEDTSELDDGDVIEDIETGDERDDQ